MYSRLVVRVIVHTLDDIDLPRHRPLRAVGPECGPRPTARRHVYAVHDDKPTGESELCLDAHRITIARNLRRGVDAHDRVAGAIDRGQVARLL